MPDRAPSTFLAIMMHSTVDPSTLTQWASVLHTGLYLVLMSSAISPFVAAWKVEIKRGRAKLQNMSSEALLGNMTLAKIIMVGAIVQKFPAFTAKQAISLNRCLKRNDKGPAHFNTFLHAINKSIGELTGASALDIARVAELVGRIGSSTAKFGFGPDNFSANNLESMIPELPHLIQTGVIHYCNFYHCEQHVPVIPRVRLPNQPNQPVVTVAGGASENALVVSNPRADKVELLNTCMIEKRQEEAILSKALVDELEGNPLPGARFPLELEQDNPLPGARFPLDLEEHNPLPGARFPLELKKRRDSRRDSMEDHCMITHKTRDKNLFTPDASTDGRNDGNDGTPTVILSPEGISPRTQRTMDAAEELLTQIEESKAANKKQLDELRAANEQMKALAKARHEEALAAAVKAKNDIIAQVSAVVRGGTAEVVNKVETEGVKNRTAVTNQISKAERERAAEQRAKDAEEKKVQLQIKEESDAKEAERKRESNAKEAELKKHIEEAEAESKAVEARAMKAVREQNQSTMDELWVAIDALEARIEKKLENLDTDSKEEAELNRASIEALKAESHKKRGEVFTVEDFLKTTLQGFQDVASKMFNNQDHKIAE